MNVTSKTLMVTFEYTVSLAQNSIQAIIQYHAWISKDKNDKIHIDLDIADIVPVSFLGVSIDGKYEKTKEFKDTLAKLGINFDKLTEEAAEKLVTDEHMECLRSMYKNTVV